MIALVSVWILTLLFVPAGCTLQKPELGEGLPALAPEVGQRLDSLSGLDASRQLVFLYSLQMLTSTTMKRKAAYHWQLAVFGHPCNAPTQLSVMTGQCGRLVMLKCFFVMKLQASL